MMKKLKITTLLLSLGAAPVACNQEEETSDLSWGHLKDQSLNPNAPQYLINLKSSDVYKVCVPQYMVDDLPGVEAEIKAAINVWAAYLGREIQVETHVKDLPRARATDQPDTLQTSYYNICGADFDVVMGYSPFKGSTVGQTGFNWRGYSAQKITSFKRYLFLRDYKISPDAWGTNRWISFEQMTNRSADSQEILDELLNRGRTEVAPRGSSIALQVLVHEFGHVWGMCDQYEGPSNCDPNFKSPHPDLNSMMAAASSYTKLYLTDDDIKGIRALANRVGFNSNWPGTEDDLNKAPAALPAKEVEYFKLKSVQKEGTQVKLNFGVVTAKKGGELRFEYRLKGAGTWQQFPTYFPSQQAFMIPDYELKQELRTVGNYEYRMNLRLRNANNTLAVPIYTSL